MQNTRPRTSAYGLEPAIAYVVIGLFGIAAFAGESLPFVTGFENSDSPAYAAGDLHGQGSGGSWLVTARTELQRIHFEAGTTSCLDDISVTHQGLDNDADNDHLSDLDEMKLHDTDPSDPDTDGDQMIDGDELFAGFSPNDSASVFRAALSPSGSQLNVSFQTITGRTYAVEQLTDLPGAD
jgi:hypothetical protein